MIMHSRNFGHRHIMFFLYVWYNFLFFRYALRPWPVVLGKHTHRLWTRLGYGMLLHSDPIECTFPILTQLWAHPRIKCIYSAPLVRKSRARTPTVMFFPLNRYVWSPDTDFCSDRKQQIMAENKTTVQAKFNVYGWYSGLCRDEGLNRA